MKGKNCAFILIFSSLILSSLFFSCKNSTETKLVYTESDTIKKSVKEKEQTITWTQELEEDRLSKRITRSSMNLGPDVIYSKELFKISNKKNAVYPDLPDFGSLDTRNINSSLKEKLNNFCKSISSENHSGADAYFSRKYIFNYVFFIKDLEDGWKKNFGIDYPKNDAKESDSKLTDTKTSDENESEEFSVFNKWTLGEPFIGSEIMQIPVRFYSTCGIIDVTIFLNSSGNNEIYQITIDRWKKV